ncbi:hypothetical protein F4556_003631 [Kitasatospora gansuensis]|uniref:Uncharacterized protein n=1 Tax=Kitasatospora gansuensis TaxID=258050 RepID=A0A7W7SCS7_9ACTN|nr:hypothetical protein [Kitasatospora gansuensis]
MGFERFLPAVEAEAVIVVDSMQVTADALT